MPRGKYRRQRDNHRSSRAACSGPREAMSIFPAPGGPCQAALVGSSVCSGLQFLWPVAQRSGEGRQGSGQWECLGPVGPAPSHWSPLHSTPGSSLELQEPFGTVSAKMKSQTGRYANCTGLRIISTHGLRLPSLNLGFSQNFPDTQGHAYLSPSPSPPLSSAAPSCRQVKNLCSPSFASCSVCRAS